MSDLIKRSDALQALVDTDEIKGYAYVALEERLKEIPAAGKSRYTEDKDRMDEIADKLAERQDIWQDRFIYWMAVAIGHILEWIINRKEEKA